MATRAIWKGSISFGLVQIPVGLYSAESKNDLSFTMLDSRDMSPVGYQRVNKSSGDAVPWDQIVKGYEWSKGEYVVLTKEDFAQANVEATQSIDIQRFVEREAIDPVYFDRPYYLEPTKNGRKAYALLRETLRDSSKVGIAKVVIRSRQHLAALYPEDDVLVLDLLRFNDELRDPDMLDLPSASKKQLGVSKAELDMAQQLVDGMSGEWDPTEYHDEYREDLMGLIEEKAEAGELNVITEYEEAPERPARRGKEADLMDLLKKSVQGQTGPGAGEGDGRKKTAAQKKGGSSKRKSGGSGAKKGGSKQSSSKKSGSKKGSSKKSGSKKGSKSSKSSSQRKSA